MNPEMLFLCNNNKIRWLPAAAIARAVCSAVLKLDDMMDIARDSIFSHKSVPFAIERADGSLVVSY
jgi:hypothetical protein